MHAKHVEPILDRLRHWFSRMEISTVRGGVGARDVSLFDLLERKRKKIVPANCVQGFKNTWWRARSHVTARLWVQFVAIDTDQSTRSYFGIGRNNTART